MKKSLKNTKLRELRQVMKRYDKIRNVLAKIGKDEVTGSSPVSSSSRDVSLHPNPLSFMVADFLSPPMGMIPYTQKTPPELLGRCYIFTSYYRFVYSIRLLSTSRATSLPSLIAHTTSDCPLRTSPAAKTFFTFV